jgi:hypothetical protein
MAGMNRAIDLPEGRIPEFADQLARDFSSRTWRQTQEAEIMREARQSTLATAIEAHV